MYELIFIDLYLVKIYGDVGKVLEWRNVAVAKYNFSPKIFIEGFDELRRDFFLFPVKKSYGYKKDQDR
jgi:hypothetical protein